MRSLTGKQWDKVAVQKLESDWKIKAGGHASPYRLRKQLPEPVLDSSNSGSRRNIETASLA